LDNHQGRVESFGVKVAVYPDKSLNRNIKKGAREEIITNPNG
jgi:hypothetical protein